MKKNYFLLLLFFSLNVSLAQPANSITMALDLSDHHPVLKGKINREELRFIFDSGATTPVILKREVINRNKDIKETGKYFKYIDTVGKITQVPQIIIPSIDLSGFLLNNVEGRIYKPWGLVLNRNVEQKEELGPELFQRDKDGIIGIGIFYHQRLIIDYPNKRMVVFHHSHFPKLYQSLKWTKCQLELNKEGLFISGLVGDKVAKFLLDTGTTASILKPKFAKPGSKSANIKRISFNDFKVDDLKFHFYDFQEPKVDGVLGYNFFLNYVVFLDLIKKQIYFAKV